MSPSLFQAHLLAHKDSPETSKDAAKRMVESGALARQEKWVYERIKKYRNDDFTTKDIAALAWEVGVEYHKAYDLCRKRFSGLERKGKIELVYEIVPHPKILNMKLKRPKQRDGCRVWRLK